VERGEVEVYRSPPSISYVWSEWEIYLFSPFTRFFALLFLRGFMVCTGRIFLFIGCYEGPDQCDQHRHVLLSKILLFMKFDVCVTVHHWYNNTNSQLDATIVVLLKFQSALHVSGDNFAHPQERYTVIPRLTSNPANEFFG
jgi:hypothetical protein